MRGEVNEEGVEGGFGVGWGRRRYVLKERGERGGRSS